jgi:hypothetical protein
MLKTAAPAAPPAPQKNIALRPAPAMVGPMRKYTAAAVLAVRLLGLFWITAGLWMLAANLIESATEFDPSFPGYYLQSQALRPILAMVLGALLWFFSGRLGRRAARGLDDPD